MQVGVIVFSSVLVFLLMHKQLVLAASQPVGRLLGTTRQEHLGAL